MMDMLQFEGWVFTHDDKNSWLAWGGDLDVKDKLWEDDLKQIMEILRTNKYVIRGIIDWKGTEAKNRYIRIKDDTITKLPRHTPTLFKAVDGLLEKVIKLQNEYSNGN